VKFRLGCAVALALAVAVPAGAQEQQQVVPPATPSAATPAPAVTPAPAPAPVVPAGVDLPAGYVVGPEDVLTIIVWREKDLSNDVTVRPDGRITLPLINDVVAQGLTPDQLRDLLKTQFDKYVEDSSVSVVVKQINSRKVFITGMVGKPGAYPLTATISVLQLISMAGGLNEFARAKEIVVMRTENGAPKAIKFNYEDVRKGRKLQQNIELRPGDTVLVP
jgi:polysaccharide export outer membrane protein